MRTNWRLYGGMIVLAAITGTVVALALSGGPRLPSDSGRRETASFSPRPSPSNGFASPSPARSSTPTPSPTPTDPLRTVKVLTATWRPTDTAAIVERTIPSGTQIIAVPLAVTGTPTPLVELPSGTQWHMRLDGSVLAIALGTSAARTRIAALSFQTGVVAWVTPDEPAMIQRSPRWSNDGSVIYFSKSGLDGVTDNGVFRIRLDGTNLTQLRSPTERVADPVGLTPDGVGLVLSRSQAGGSLDILDLNTRVMRTYAADVGGAAVNAWRPLRPRALVSVGVPAVGPTTLTLWDDLGPTVVRTLVSQSLLGGSDWDPTGTRIVAAVGARVSASSLSLVTMDVTGEARTTLAGTDGAAAPYWLRAGIVYLWGPSVGRYTEVRLSQPTGTAAPRVLYRDSDLTRLFYVSP